MSRARKRRANSRRREINVLSASWEARILAPKCFALEEHRHDTLVEFLTKLREAFHSGSKVVCIDFRQTEKMIAGGTLLFYSELQRLRAMFSTVPVRCVPSKNSVVNQVLEHLNIFQTLGYESDIVPVRQDVVSWRVVSSEEIDGAKVGELLETYKSLSGPVVGQLFRGAGEAMFNVRHAYEEGRNDGLPEPSQKRWWMFCREAEGELFVAVCDLGIGIPRSLPLKHPSEVIQSVIDKIPGIQSNLDAKMICAAMQMDRTGTNLSGRGKGLADFKRVIDAVPGARLFIFSNRGLVRYQGGAQKRVSFDRSIKGTVVVWTIPIFAGEADK